MSLLTQGSAAARGAKRRSTVAKAAEDLGLQIVARESFSVRRRRSGKGWTYIDASDRPIRDKATIRRLNRLAVPPAYQDVMYSKQVNAHLQAVGRDAAGRLQYRYHPEWEKVREIRKARRLERLAAVLPRIKRSIGQHLGGEALTSAFACSAVIELIARTAIRSGSESYAKLRGTRGAATLLKSNVRIQESAITLTFRAKGGKKIVKALENERLAAALQRLSELPGRRMFQSRGEDGNVRPVTTRQVNAFLREIAGVNISLKDFRTLLATASVLESLCAAKPAASERQRRKQVMQAVRAVADDLANTPAICRKSYVHTTVVEAFEEGVLERFAEVMKTSRSAHSKTQAVAKVLCKSAANGMH